MLAQLYPVVAVSALLQLVICLLKKTDKKAKLLPVKIVFTIGLVMAAWALADTGHTTTLMYLFPPGTFPVPDSYIIVIVLYHAALGLGIAWAVYTLIMRCISGIKTLISLFNED